MNFGLLFGQIAITRTLNEAKAILAAADALRRGNYQGFLDTLPQAVREKLITHVLNKYSVSNR